MKDIEKARTMKIVIDLDEKYYNDIKNSPTASNYSTLYALFGIRNGTLLSDELEKIKAEIENIRDVEVTDGIIYANEFDVFDILDKRIADLKGESDEIQRSN